MSDYDKPQVLPAWAEGGDVNDIPTSPEIQEGWPLNNTPPTRQRFNWILNWLANGIRYFMQMGIPEWDAEEDYRLNSRVQKIDGTLWRALRPNTNVEPGTSALDWVSFFSNELAPYAKLDGSTAYTGDLNMNTHKVSGVSNATDADDAVNKGQMDALDTAKVNRAGDTVSNYFTLSSDTNDAALTVVVPAAKNALVQFGRWVAAAIKVRWALSMTSGVESGANAGSDVSLSRYADDGTYIDSPLTISRASGFWTLKGVINALTGAFELGTPGTASTNYIDFHSSANVNDFDTRIEATSGAATAGQGTMTLYAANVNATQGLTCVNFNASQGIGVGNTANATKLHIGGWGSGRGYGIVMQPSLTGSNAAMSFLANGGGQVGSINCTDSNTSYNTSSDYRLKQNYTLMSGALASVMRMKFYTGEFIAEPGELHDYALAHELQEEAPNAVSGEKDAMGDWWPVYREGYDPNNIQPEDIVDVVQEIVAQGVDYSKLVPRMGAAIQELSTQLAQALARIEQLEAR